MKRTIFAVTTLVLGICLAPVVDASSAHLPDPDIIYFGHDFEDSNIGGTVNNAGAGFGDGTCTVTVKVIDDTSSFTDESKVLYYKLEGTDGQSEIQFSNVDAAKGWAVETVFMVPDTATLNPGFLNNGCRVMKTLGLSGDFWIMDSGDPNTFILQTWHYVLYEKELERGVWHRLEAQNQGGPINSNGGWNKYYVDDEFWVRSGVGVQDPALPNYGFRGWLGRDNLNMEYEVLVDRFICFKPDYPAHTPLGDYYFLEDFENWTRGLFEENNSGESDRITEVIDGASPATGESKMLHYGKFDAGGYHGLQADIQDTNIVPGYTIEVVFMVPDTATIYSPDWSGGCMVLNCPGLASDFWLKESTDTENFVLRTSIGVDTFAQPIYVDVEVTRGDWHKLEAVNQADVGGGVNKYYVDDVEFLETSTGIDTINYGSVVFIGRFAGFPDPLYEVYIDHIYIYPAAETVEDVTIDSTFTVSWTSDIGDTYMVYWSPSLDPANWQDASGPIVAVGTTTSWQDVGDPPRLAPTDPSVTKRFYKVEKLP